jgi:hypothetical protein
MAKQKYQINGTVIDGNTQTGVSGLKVEAWDKDMKYDDLVGVAYTGRDGSFIIKFDNTYFREYAKDDQPDLYFKVFRGEKLLKNTKDSVIANASQREQVVITLELYSSITEGKDRLTPKQAFTAYNFIMQSDFKGIRRETKNKTGSGLRFIRDMVTGSLENLKPIKVQGVREENIVGRDTNTVQADLNKRDVAVANVLPYNPKLNNESFKQLSGHPISLKPGQRVNLYEKDGKVKYYSVVKEDSRSEDIKSIREELVNTKTQVQEREQKIATLESELVKLRAEQATMKKQMEKQPEGDLKIEIEALKKQFDTLKAGTTKTTPTKTTRKESSNTSKKK